MITRLWVLSVLLVLCVTSEAFGHWSWRPHTHEPEPTPAPSNQSGCCVIREQDVQLECSGSWWRRICTETVIEGAIINCFDKTPVSQCDGKVEIDTECFTIQGCPVSPTPTPVPTPVPTTPPPPQPELVMVTITWQDNSDNEAGFTIERMINGEDFELISDLPPNVERDEDIVLADGSEYCYVVFAFNEYGESPSDVACILIE